MRWASAISSSNMFHYVMKKQDDIHSRAEADRKIGKRRRTEVAIFVNFFLDVLLFFIAVPSLILLDIG
jgi:hypothetical protein